VLDVVVIVLVLNFGQPNSNVTAGDFTMDRDTDIDIGTDDSVAVVVVKVLGGVTGDTTCC